MTRYACLTLVALSVFLAACGDTAGAMGGSGGVSGPGGSGGSGGSTDVVPPLPWPATAFPSLPEVAKNVPEARIQLGNFLFYDTILSVDQLTACATCHSEFWGMSDALPLAVGNGAGPLAGPGREGENTLRRNSPTLFNMAFRESLFWDGRTATLEEQAILPLLAEDELNLDPADAIAELEAIPEYVDLFAEAFPEDPRVTLDNLASALAAFQRSFVSDRSLYDAYVRGHNTLNDELIDAMFLFGEMGCNECHTPPLFESEIYANRSVPGSEESTDEGRAEVTGDPEDRGKFRTPPLRNIADTKPYFHNGSVEKLDDAIRHELDQSGLPYTEEEVRLLKLFISKALRDDSRMAARPKNVPSGLPTPLDGPIFPGR